MNLILFQPQELPGCLPLTDPRAVHLRDVLGRRPGDLFDAGILNGPRGKARLEQWDGHVVWISFQPQAPSPDPLPPIRLIVGLPRPQTARKILQEATALGIEGFTFVHTEKGDPAYAASRLWSTGEWRRHVIAGAEQAFTTALPEVSFGMELMDALALTPAQTNRAALDNYEAGEALSRAAAEAGHWTLVLGGERGWSTAERNLLRAHGFSLFHLGERVLRTETACVAALTLVKAKLGLG